MNGVGRTSPAELRGFLAFFKETRRFAEKSSLEERDWTGAKLTANMADSTSLPSWPVILNKSLEESDIHRLLGQNHKVRGNLNPRKMFLDCFLWI